MKQDIRQKYVPRQQKSCMFLYIRKFKLEVFETWFD